MKKSQVCEEELGKRIRSVEKSDVWRKVCGRQYEGMRCVEESWRVRGGVCKAGVCRVEEAVEFMVKIYLVVNFTVSFLGCSGV